MKHNHENYSLSHKQASNNKYKVLRVKEERCKYKITPKHVIEEEIEELDEKSLYDPQS